MTGPARSPTQLLVQIMPVRMPSSWIGTLCAVAGGTRLIQEPETKPYDIRPMTTSGAGVGNGVQNASWIAPASKEEAMNTRHTPRRSARYPHVARPRREPVWTNVTAYEGIGELDVEGEPREEEAKRGALK